jgi:hypothetical protein
MVIEGGGESGKPTRRYGLVSLKSAVGKNWRIPTTKIDANAGFSYVVTEPAPEINFEFGAKHSDFGVPLDKLDRSSDLANPKSVKIAEYLKPEPPKYTLKQRFLRSIFLSKDYPKPRASNYKADYVELDGGKFSYSIKSVPVTEEIKSTVESSENWLSKVSSGGSYVYSETPEQIAKFAENIGKGASKAGKFAMVGLGASAALGAIVGGVGKQASHAEMLATQRQFSGLGLAEQPAFNPAG